MLDELRSALNHSSHDLIKKSQSPRSIYVLELFKMKGRLDTPERKTSTIQLNSCI